ncbi:MAG: hypothetical protein M5U09_27965 [Gammaproteobacteria bacterium]|nr:hypothetical protein [Gammaproteobacteria bacterium]
MVLLVHQQWIRNERLTFPLVYLPLELTAVEQDQAYSQIWRDSTFWIGFTIAVVPHLFNGLHTYYPAVPEHPVQGGPEPDPVTSAPWRHLGPMPINFYPGMIGFAALLPLDVSFTVWVFFVIERFLTMFRDRQRLDRRHQRRLDLVPVLAGAVGRRVAGADRHRALDGPPPPQDRAVRLGADQPRGCPDAPAGPGRVRGLPGDPDWLGATWRGWTRWSPSCSSSCSSPWCWPWRGSAARPGSGASAGPMMPQDLMMLVTGSRAYNVRDLTVMSTYRWFTVEFRGAPRSWGTSSRR